MNYKYKTNRELIDLLAIRFKYNDEVVTRWERRHRTIDFKKLEQDMKEKELPKAYYDMIRQFKIYNKGQLMMFLIAIKKGRL
tara:strand:+ start:13520 stop:13765 length:246 start_codon:yes stop_codon:yes gene_type:complete